MTLALAGSFDTMEIALLDGIGVLASPFRRCCWRRLGSNPGVCRERRPRPWLFFSVGICRTQKSHLQMRWLFRRCWWRRLGSNPWVCRERRPRPWVFFACGNCRAQKNLHKGGFFVGVGGGGGNRTRVRRHSPIGSTCLVPSFDLTPRAPTGRIPKRDSSKV